ncbi:chymotrypsin inhibitor 3-like [Silene latifolia]|uniref:chymotrypsin inhibitor 3-like n=1 Tax=Silene latifolia TaxID=37657 RepID=UPI003D777A09
MSSLLFQASITIFLLLPFSTAYLVDIDRDPIINGRDYYIVPLDSLGGLTYIHKKGFCPLYIAPIKKYDSPVIPVKISSPLKTLHISLDERVSLAFTGNNPCEESLVWRQTLDPLARKVYITTGGVEGDRSFSITKKDKSDIPFYELKYWPSNEEDGNVYVGLYEDDGFLGLTQYPNTTVLFQKAFNDLELSTS